MKKKNIAVGAATLAAAGVGAAALFEEKITE